MKPIIAFLVSTTLALPAAASTYSCQPLGVLEVANARLDAKASKDTEPVVNSPVALYSDRKPAGKTQTDSQGHFAFDHLAPGKYELVIAGLGSFNIEVKPQADRQQMYYGFASVRGCLTSGFSTN